MLIRQWLTVAAALWKPRLRVVDECTTPVRVLPNDLDANLHLTNSRYLLAMDMGRWDFATRCGMGRVMYQRRWFPLVGSAMLRFRKGLAPFQRFELRTRIVAWDEKWCWFEQRFCVGETVYAVGRVKVLFRGARGNVSTAELLAACGERDVPPVHLPEAIRLWQQAEDADRVSGAARNPCTPPRTARR